MFLLMLADFCETKARSKLARPPNRAAPEQIPTRGPLRPPRRVSESHFCFNTWSEHGRLILVRRNFYGGGKYLHCSVCGALDCRKHPYLYAWEVLQLSLR